MPENFALLLKRVFAVQHFRQDIAAAFVVLVVLVCAETTSVLNWDHERIVDLDQAQGYTTDILATKNQGALVSMAVVYIMYPR